MTLIQYIQHSEQIEAARRDFAIQFPQFTRPTTDPAIVDAGVTAWKQYLMQRNLIPAGIVKGQTQSLSSI